MDNMNNKIRNLQEAPSEKDWLELAKLTLTRLILFNKRRRAEVKDIKVDTYLQRSKWHKDTNQEMLLSLSETDKIFSARMDMVVCAGKSLKNNDVYVLLPP